MSEERIQFEIIEWYRNHYCLKHHVPRCCIFSVPNDGKDLNEQMRKKSTGMVAGVSDLIVLQPNKCMFVEVKTHLGRQSDKQKEFEAQVQALGFEYHLVRSLQDFQIIINGQTD